MTGSVRDYDECEWEWKRIIELEAALAQAQEREQDLRTLLLCQVRGWTDENIDIGLSQLAVGR